MMGSQDIAPDPRQLLMAHHELLEKTYHSGLREQLAELGVGVDLHLVASPLVTQFMTDLRSHAKREDALAYRWAAENLSPEAKTALAIELRRPDRATRR